MQVVNIKELKARLSAYLREVARGQEFLVTDRGRVVARLGPVLAEHAGAESTREPITRLVAMGARAPLRERRPGDYRRAGDASGLSTPEIDALLDHARGER
jgi:prevent-host-death family protein